MIGKLFKNNNAFIYRKTFNKFFILDKKYDTPLMRDFIANPEHWLNSSKELLLKTKRDEAKRAVSLVDLFDTKIAVKCYNVMSFTYFLKRCLLKSRAMHSWLNIYKLQTIGVATLKPIAVIENRIGLLRKETYLLTEYSDNSVRGCDYFGKDAEPTKQWKTVVQRIAEMIDKLKNEFLIHRDFQYGNILIIDGSPLLLDLDAMKKHRKNSLFFRRAFAKDINHFLDFVRSNKAAYSMFIEEFKKHGLL